MSNEYRMSKREGCEALATFLNAFQFRTPRSVSDVRIDDETGDFLCVLGAEKKKRVRKARSQQAVEAKP